MCSKTQLSHCLTSLCLGASGGWFYLETLMLPQSGDDKVRVSRRLNWTGCPTQWLPYLGVCLLRESVEL